MSQATTAPAPGGLRSSRRFTLGLIYARQISASLLIYQPIFIPFLLARGLNMLDVAILQTAYNLGVLVLDIPTGFFADRFGRKWALALCNASLAIGTFLICIGHSLTVFIIAELFYAFAIAMDAGVHSAYLFEWLKENKDELEYYRYDALGTFLVLVLGALGTLIAGYYAEQSLLAPVAATVVLTSLGIPAAILLPERKRAKGEIAPTVGATDRMGIAARRHRFSDLFHDLGSIKHITLELLRRPGLRWALGLTIIWFWSRQYVNLIISQPYFKSIGLELRHFGMLYAAMTLSSGVIALFSRRLMQRPDLKAVSIIGLLLIPGSFAIMGLVPGTLGLAGFFLFAIPYGLCTAVTNTLLNRQFDQGQNRATFLSIVDFFVRLFASVLAILLGWILAQHGASAALIAATILSAIVVGALLPGARLYAADHRAIELRNKLRAQEAEVQAAAQGASSATDTATVEPIT